MLICIRFICLWLYDLTAGLVLVKMYYRLTFLQYFTSSRVKCNEFATLDLFDGNLEEEKSLLMSCLNDRRY